MICDTFHLAYDVTMHRTSRGLALCIVSISTVACLQAAQQIIVVYIQSVPQFVPLDDDMHPPHDSPHGI